jgi:glycosyltransferase involved in cell wall biosynthesis
MKILHVVPSYKPAYIYGGPIESVSKLCEGLAAHGHDVDVYTTTANGEAELDIVPGTTMVVDGVKVTYFKRITKDPTHVSPDLWRAVNSSVKEYDIVHVQSWWNILVVVATCICHLKKVKVLISPRGMLSQYIFETGNTKMKKLIHYTAGKWALSKSWFHATADSEAIECREIISEWKGFIEPNILTLPDLPIEKNINKVFTLIFLSRVHPKKGIEILLHAISKLQFPVLFKIAGSGEDEYIKQLKDLIVRLDITEKVIWTGWLDREQKFLELMHADLFVLVSLNENFANVVVESLHMGTSVLLSEEVGLAGFVRAYDQGWVSTLEVADVALKISAAYIDHDKRARIREQGRSVIESHFSADKLISNYVTAYQRIIDAD